VATCSWFADGRSKSTRILDGATAGRCHELPLEGATSALFQPGRALAGNRSASGTQPVAGTHLAAGPRFEGSPVFSPDGSLSALSRPFGGSGWSNRHRREVARLTVRADGYAPACFTPDGTRRSPQCRSKKAILRVGLRLIASTSRQ